MTRFRRVNESRRQGGCGFVGQAQCGGMLEAAELASNRRVDLRLSVSVEIGPDRGIRVEVFPVIHIPKHGPFASCDDDGFPLQPVAHLGEWMPDELMVEFCQWMHVNGINQDGGIFASD